MRDLDKLSLRIEKDERAAKRVRQRRFERRVYNFFQVFFVSTFVVLSFFAAMVVIDRKSMVYELNQKNLLLEKEAAELRSKISEINVLISAELSLDNIERVAKEELGMVYPDSSRVVGLSITEYYALDDDLSRGTFSEDMLLVRDETLEDQGSLETVVSFFGSSSLADSLIVRLIGE